MRIRPVLVGILVGIVGCTSSQRDEDPPNQLECSPASLSAGGSWDITMPLPHSMELAIIDPDGRFFLVAFDEPLAGIQPMIDTAAFRRLDQLSVLTAEAEAAYRGSGGKWEHIFTKSGRYEALLGAGLRAEHPLIDGQCAVDYTAAAMGEKPTP